MTLKELRKEKEWTQGQLAEKIGVSQCAISFWESGRSQPSDETSEKIAELFGVYPDDIDIPEPRYKGRLEASIDSLAQLQGEDPDIIETIIDALLRNWKRELKEAAGLNE